MVQLILACIAIGIFTAYCIVACCLFGVPISLSHTYYYYNERYPGTGWVFTAMIVVVSFMLVYPWIYATHQVSSWSHWFGFLPFLCCAMLVFVAFAPNARNKWVQQVHMICAKLAAVFAILWICIVCWKIMYVLPAWILLCGGVAHLTHTAKTCRDWWWEMVAFGATFTCIIVELVLALNK